MPGLIYNASDFQRHLWEDHKLEDGIATTVEAAATKRYEAFPDFAGEMFHYFHAEEPERLEKPASGSEVFQALDSAMRQVPEVEDLRSQTIGNDRWAGVVTTSMVETLLNKVTPPDEQVPDIRGDEDVLEYMERLMAQAMEDVDLEQSDELIYSSDEIEEEIDRKKKLIKAAADAMDPTDIRQALRGAAKAATKTIQEEQKLMDAFGVGTDPHSGRRAQMGVSAKLSKLVGSNERLRKIAEYAGRLRRIATEEQRKKPRYGCGERVGRKPDNDLARLCHRELVYGAEQMRHMFCSKYAERSLACIEKADRKKEEQGPIVMVLDSSGSMSSCDADVWAAAVCLAYLDIAKQQNRDFAIVHFGSKVERIDRFIGKNSLTPEAITSAVNFFAASGGTNFEDSLDTAVEIIRSTGEFTKADIVMVTDGCASITANWLHSWNNQKARYDFRCYSILVGDSASSGTNKQFSDDVVHLAEAIRDEEKMHRFFGKV